MDEPLTLETLRGLWGRVRATRPAFRFLTSPAKLAEMQGIPMIAGDLAPRFDQFTGRTSWTLLGVPLDVSEEIAVLLDASQRLVLQINLGPAKE